MSGMEILRKLREEEPRLESTPAVIVISARDDMKTTVQAVQLGAYDYLVKPPTRIAFGSQLPERSSSGKPRLHSRTWWPRSARIMASVTSSASRR